MGHLIMLTKVTLGQTGLSVSQLCYGTNMLGWKLDQAKSNAILDTFAELGGNFIDTARVYGDWAPDGPVGASERALGAWLKTRQRDQFVIATKGGLFDLRVGDWRSRVTPQDITADLTQSLDHLGIATIDLYFVHTDNPDVPVEPIIDTLIGHREAGLIRHFAASNWSAARITAANVYAASLGKPGFVASETFWGLGVPDAAAATAEGYQHYYEGEYEALHASGLPFLAYASQSGGYFTKRASGADPGRLGVRYGVAVNDRRLAAAQALAGAHGASINEIVLAYMINQPLQTIPIFGGSSPEQVRSSVKAATLVLTREELAQLRNA
jgi:aryl-alcohol dehydrogenase-like predicted oxidoreductase